MTTAGLKDSGDGVGASLGMAGSVGAGCAGAVAAACPTVIGRTHAGAAAAAAADISKEWFACAWRPCGVGGGEGRSGGSLVSRVADSDSEPRGQGSAADGCGRDGDCSGDRALCARTWIGWMWTIAGEPSQWTDSCCCCCWRGGGGIPAEIPTEPPTGCTGALSGLGRVVLPPDPAPTAHPSASSMAPLPNGGMTLLVGP